MLRKITKEEVFGVYAAVPVYFALAFDTVAIQRTQASFLKKLKRCHDPIEKYLQEDQVSHRAGSAVAHRAAGV